MRKPILRFSAVPSARKLTLTILWGMLLLLQIPVWATYHTISEPIIIHFDQTTCDNVTDGGIVSGDEIGCADPIFAPSTITNIEEATGGSGTLEYLWMYTTDDISGAFVSWSIVPNSDSPDLQPEPISQTTHYVRCARRSGCTEYSAESNYVTKTVSCAPICTMTVSTTAQNTTCANSSDGHITATPNDGAPPYSYSWSNAATSPSISNLSAGNYTVTVTDSEGCSATASQNVSAGTAISILINKIDANCGENNGSTQTSISGGTSPYTYTWSNGATTAFLQNLAPDNYSLTVTDQNGCSATQTVVVDGSTGLMAAASSNQTECGEDNGSATVTVTGGIMPYNYIWNDMSQQTTATATNLAAGTYEVTITDQNGCSATEIVSVSANTTTTLSLSMTPPTCAGATDGSIQTNLDGDTQNATFVWDNAPNIQNPTNLSAGTYCVTVTDRDNCQLSDCITVLDGNSPIISLSTTPTSCGENNGSIQTTVSGSTTGLGFHWDNAPNAANLVGLAAGNYCLTVTDQNGCTDTDCVEILSSEGIEISLSPIEPSCGMVNGAIATLATGGTAPYSYHWDNANDVQNPTSLAAGMYCVTVTDAADCTATDCLSLNSTSAIDLTLQKINPTCGQANGSILTTISGGNGNYTFNWDNAPDIQNPTGLPNGTYCLTVMDGDGCLISDCITLNGVEPIEIDFGETHPSCGLPNGHIEATISGGSGSYTYEWDTFENTLLSQNNVAAGTYCISITDDTGCATTDCVTLVQGPALTATLTPTHIDCAGDATGAIDVAIDSGTLPYFYTWNSGSYDQNLTNLAAGEYCVTIEDRNFCTFETCVTITQPDAISTAADLSHPTCGEANGSIQLTTSGGNGSYSYLWNTGATTANLDMLSVGEYCVTITDENDCTLTECYTLESSEVLTTSLNPQNPLCADGLGMIDATITGGTAPYTISWSNDDTNTNSISDLPQGNYCITVTDADMCQVVACADIAIPSNLEILLTPNNPTCFEDTNGSIELLANGGTGTYAYLWNTDATTQHLENIGAGNYCVTVSDENMCTATACIELTTASTLLLEGTTTDITCNGAMDGTITLTATGGNGGYTYLWNDDTTTPNRANLSGGNYCVTLADANNCTFSECFDITEPTILSNTFATTNPECFGENTGRIDLTASGGTAPYSYLWENDSTDEDRENLFDGTYCVTITDANGCTYNDCVTLTAPTYIAIIGNGQAPTCTGGNDGHIELTVTGGQTPYTYLWDTGAMVADPTGLSAGTYCVTVTDNNGCSQDACTIILDQAPIQLDITWEDATCQGNDGGLFVNVLVGSGTYSYLWDTPNMDTTPTVTGLAPGVYTVTVTDGNGCSAVDSAAIDGPGPTDCFDLVNIGDWVWNDNDQDGIQDQDEVGVPNVVVNLIASGEDGIFNTADDVVFDTQTTDTNGNYLFEDVVPGTYIIEIVPSSLPSGVNFTETNEGSDDTIDSDIGFFSGQTEPFTITDGQPDDLSFDAGVYLACQNVTNGGEICCDQMVCGAGADPDPILNITPATGGVGELEYLWMMSTTGTPFSPTNPDWVPIINSNNESFDPAAVYQTTYYIRCARRRGCTSFTIESNMVTISIKEIPEATITNLPNEICDEQTTSISAAEAGTGATYEWNFGTGATPSTATTRTAPSVSWSSLGVKTVSLTVQLEGCTNSATETIDVINCADGGVLQRFVSFEVVETDDHQVRLHWQTNPQLNDYMFVVEHSKDGEKYGHVDVLEGGSLNMNHQYVFEHEQAPKGNNFYRIKHFNAAGEMDMTDRRHILMETTTIEFQVFPNPVMDYLRIEPLQNKVTIQNIQLLSATGQVISTDFVEEPFGIYDLDTSNLPAGLYYIVLQTNGKTQVLKVIVSD